MKFAPTKRQLKWGLASTILMYFALPGPGPGLAVALGYLIGGIVFFGLLAAVYNVLLAAGNSARHRVGSGSANN